MNIEKYCTYSKRLRVTAYVIKFINNLKGQSKKSNNNLSTFITKQKHDLTGYLWLTYIEKDVFTGKGSQNTKIFLQEVTFQIGHKKFLLL